MTMEQKIQALEVGQQHIVKDMHELKADFRELKDSHKEISKALQILVENNIQIQNMQESNKRVHKRIDTLEERVGKNYEQFTACKADKPSVVEIKEIKKELNTLKIEMKGNATADGFIQKTLFIVVGGLISSAFFLFRQ